jgi:hypothetical protein
MILKIKYLLFILLPVMVQAFTMSGVKVELTSPDKLVLYITLSNPADDQAYIEGESFLRYSFPEANHTRQVDNFLMRVLNIPLSLTHESHPGIKIEIIQSSPFIRKNKKTSDIFASFSDIRLFRSSPMVDLIIDPFAYRDVFVQEARVEISFQSTRNINQELNSVEKNYIRDVVINPVHTRSFKSKLPLSTLKKTDRLESGTWYQIGIRETGIYSISGQYLQDNGVVLSNLNKSGIRMVTSPTRGRPYTSKLPQSPYIQEIPVIITGDSESPFERQDKLIFYGEGVSGWNAALSGKPESATYNMNPYEKTNHYWIFIPDAGVSKPSRMLMYTNTHNPDAENRSFYWGRMHHEKEEANLIQGGTSWYGESFNGPASNRVISLPLINPASDLHDDAFIRFGVAGASKTGYSTHRHDFEFSLNNQVIWGKITAFDYTESSKMMQIDTDILNETNSLFIKYSGNNDNTKAFLDYVDIIYPARLTAADDYLHIWYPAQNIPVSFDVSGFNSSLIYVFDISDPLNPRYFISGKKQFSLYHSRTELAPEYLILTESHFLTPATFKTPSVDPVLPVAYDQTDMVIITHRDFLPAAERLKEFRESRLTNPLKVTIFTMDEIYAKFSAGNQDPHAIRNLLYDLSVRAPEPSPYYLLLFGDGDYDYRNISGKSKIFVPQYCITAGSIIHTRNTDDPFVYLSSDTDKTPDMAVGRIPSNSLKEANDYVDKLIAYETRQVTGDWQMRVTLIADDPTNPWPNEPEFIRDTENTVLPTFPKAFKINKIYLTEFPELYDPTIGSMGRVGAREAVLEAFTRGTFLMNYVGHGSPFVWAQEYIFTKDRDLNQVRTNGQYPFIVAATCDWGRSDFIGIQSMGEEMVNAEKNGAIGVVASTRGVINLDNIDFTKKMYEHLFPDNKNSTHCRTLGAAYLTGKVQAWSNLNVSKFQFFGDPALKPAVPHMNGVISVHGGDTLKALSRVDVDGYVIDLDQNRITDPPLKGWIELYDSERPITREYRYLSGGVYRTGTLNYSLPGSRLFSGQISIENSDFTARFIIPKDIQYEGNNGIIRLRYASDDHVIEGAAYKDKLILAGSSDTVSADFSGPVITLMTENEEFSGSTVIISDTTDLIIRLKDPAGINITGSPGHSITMTTGGKDHDLTGLFVYDTDSWQEGRIRLKAGEWFAEGEQDVEISGFDNFNNYSNETFYIQMVSYHDDILTDVMNYPNPFKSSTHFTFRNFQSGDVSIKIFTLNGLLVEEIYGGYKDRGFNSVFWDGYDSFGDKPAAGLYLYTLKLDHENGSSSTRGKLVLLP